MCRKTAIFLILIFLIYLLAISVSANAPPSAELEGTTEIPPSVLLTLLALPVIVLLPLAVTCFSEWLTSVAFQLHKMYGGIIIRVNLASQGVMWALYLIFSLLVRVWFRADPSHYYVLFIAALELVIYIGEYFTYKRIMRSVSNKRCLLYTLTANTISLSLGLMCNYIVF